MKYLKKYNESTADIDIQEIINNCKDILLDIKDDGFSYECVMSQYDIIEVSVFRSEIFSRDNIEDCRRRLVKYLFSEGFVSNLSSDHVKYIVMKNRVTGRITHRYYYGFSFKSYTMSF